LAYVGAFPDNELSGAMRAAMSPAARRRLPLAVQVSGAKVLTSIVQGAGQPIVHISASGTATFGAANVTFAIDAAGKLVTRVTNIVLH
jgi:hypothetical protein